MFSVGIGIAVNVCHWKGPSKLPAIVMVETGQLVLFLAAKCMQKCLGYYFKCSNTRLLSILCYDALLTYEKSFYSLKKRKTFL